MSTEKRSFAFRTVANKPRIRLSGFTGLLLLTSFYDDDSSWPGCVIACVAVLRPGNEHSTNDQSPVRAGGGLGNVVDQRPVVSRLSRHSLCATAHRFAAVSGAHFGSICFFYLHLIEAHVQKNVCTDVSEM